MILISTETFQVCTGDEGEGSAGKIDSDVSGVKNCVNCGFLEGSPFDRRRVLGFNLQ